MFTAANYVLDIHLALLIACNVVNGSKKMLFFLHTLYKFLVFRVRPEVSDQHAFMLNWIVPAVIWIAGKPDYLLDGDFFIVKKNLKNKLGWKIILISLINKDFAENKFYVQLESELEGALLHKKQGQHLQFTYYRPQSIV